MRGTLGAGSTSTLNAQERFKALMEGTNNDIGVSVSNSSDLDSAINAAISSHKNMQMIQTSRDDGNSQLLVRKSTMKDKGMLGSLNMLKNEVDQGDDEYVNHAISNGIDQNKSVEARQTLIQGHQVVMAERVSRLSKAQVQAGLQNNQYMNPNEYNSKIAKRDQQARRNFTVPPQKVKARSLCMEMVMDGCIECGDSRHRNN